MGFGKKLEEKMSEKGIKQADIVRATGISKTTLSSMISRDNTKVDVEIFIRICKYLGCDPMEFSSDVQINKNNDSFDYQRILNNAAQLNEDGLEALADYSDFLINQEKFKKALDIPREA